MKAARLVLAFLSVATFSAAQAGSIGIGAFSGGTVTTFDNLSLPFTSPTPRVLDGNTYTTNNGVIRYTQPNSFDADCNGECIGNDADLGYIDVTLGSAADRVGARVGGAATSYAGYVEFFDVNDVLLGSVNYGNNAGMVFVGWEDLVAGIGRVRVHDTASNARIVHMDDFRFEGSRVPEPGSVALLGLALAGLAATRRRKRKQ